MIEAAYSAWMNDQANGLATILVADSIEAVHVPRRPHAHRTGPHQTRASRAVASVLVWTCWSTSAARCLCAWLLHK